MCQLVEPEIFRSSIIQERKRGEGEGGLLTARSSGDPKRKDLGKVCGNFHSDKI